MPRLICLLIVLFAWLPAPAPGQPHILESGPGQARLLELYTSEGCSSCPPADAWLSQFKNDEGLWSQFIPVAFHVDYWDRLGWPDPFAQARFSQRQRDYAKILGRRSIYTPGFVLDGRQWRGWFNGEPLMPSIAKPLGPLRLSLNDSTGTATFAAPDLPADLLLHLVVMGCDLRTEVKRGENRGRSLGHDFVALGYDQWPLTLRDGQYHAEGPLPTAEQPTQALAAWVSRTDRPGPLQALGGWLPPERQAP
ncbi:MAG: DUF1223 domain-containing protein [Candidatus Latescibacteria bacterium]|nr:DUF1223 domain-containing protein [Candidatus Latescibacterota bacterium]